ncbi:helix-turn-helix transcriptional regulator [Aeromonas aquatica]|uniref:helix-turn-helix transcriptional regulator n=1 Tax=Aeromonas aquatica TaxID=558964 RepID=UPI00286EF219|nr:helix-turn-helix transcriptional regulator [Aeromonas aquatica]
MSTPISEKLALVRESERMTKKEFAELVSVPYGTYVYYESGRNVPSTEIVMRIFNNPRLEKYALWFFTDKIAPESGQIAPVLAHFGQDETGYSASGQKTG